MRDRMIINGGRPLNGTITAQGSKNAALPVMAASLLLRGQTLTIERVPDLQDIHTMADLLRYLGVAVDFDHGRMTISVPEQLSCETPPDLVRRMRASSLVLGPLVARCGCAVLPLPGGCAIGSRPIDLHLKALSKMGADIDLEQGSVHAKTTRLEAAKIAFDFPSVGATENIMMAAALIDDETIISNAAKEPEIVNLADTLVGMGARIEGAGTDTVKIIGKKDLASSSVAIIPDRIEASTYLLAGVITRGCVRINDICPDHISSLFSKLNEAGIETEIGHDHIAVSCLGKTWGGASIKTLPYPGFPTDVQPQIMAALSIAEGTSVIHESVFESRFMHVAEFKKMGAKIDIQGNTVVINGVPHLSGAEVRATDLRAGAALILMGLAAEGRTTVSSLKHVWRGYEGLMNKFSSLGAAMTLVDNDDDYDSKDDREDAKNIPDEL